MILDWDISKVYHREHDTILIQIALGAGLLGLAELALAKTSQFPLAICLLD